MIMLDIITSFPNEYRYPPERQSHRMRPSQAVASGQAVTLTATNRGRALPCLSMNDAPAAEKSATNIGEITFGGPIFNVVSLNYLGKRHKKKFTKSLGGGMAPVAP